MRAQVAGNVGDAGVVLVRSYRRPRPEQWAAAQGGVTQALADVSWRPMTSLPADIPPQAQLCHLWMPGQYLRNVQLWNVAAWIREAAERAATRAELEALKSADAGEWSGNAAMMALQPARGPDDLLLPYMHVPLQVHE